MPPDQAQAAAPGHVGTPTGVHTPVPTFGRFLSPTASVAYGQTTSTDSNRQGGKAMAHRYGIWTLGSSGVGVLLALLAFLT
jgi:hypothetical protein